jgi:hypothetical protein
MLMVDEETNQSIENEDFLSVCNNKFVYVVVKEHKVENENLFVGHLENTIFVELIIK